jgi:hypothetical protein
MSVMFKVATMSREGEKQQKKGCPPWRLGGVAGILQAHAVEPVQLETKIKYLYVFLKVLLQKEFL